MQIPLSIPKNHDVFSGHFPDDPLLPGALLIEWIAQSIEASSTFSITEIKKVKFIKPVRPNEKLILTLNQKQDHLIVEASSEKGTHIKGKFFYV